MKSTNTNKKTEVFDDPRGYDPELESLIGTAKNHEWSDEEIALLTRYYGRVNTRKIAEKLGRPFTGVSSKAQSLGLKFKSPVDLVPKK
jgi:hypothetical protein